MESEKTEKILENRPRAGFKNLRIGEILVRKGLITEEILGKALERKKTEKKRLGRILVEMETVTEKDISTTLSEQLGMPIVDLEEVILDPEVVNLLPPKLLKNMEF